MRNVAGACLHKALHYIKLSDNKGHIVPHADNINVRFNVISKSGKNKTVGNGNPIGVNIPSPIGD